MKNKKSQLTMLILLGMTIFLLISIALYLSKLNLNKQNEVKNSQEANFASQPIKDYIQQCLDRAGAEALNLIGQQGGYIYTSQGGNLVDFVDADQGIMFTKNGQYKVAYNVLPPRSDVGLFFSQSPEYPWITFPYRTQNSATEEFNGFFGMGRMPPLTSYQGPDSIQSQMEDFIERSVSKCSLNSFSEQGYSIFVEKPKISVVVGDRDVSIRMNYPVHITGASQQSFDLKDFLSKIDVRLKSTYLFAKGIINDDTSNINFNIADNDNNKDGFIVNVIRDNFKNDDIITVSDTQSLLNGKPYHYTFSRKNRAPALYYVRDNLLEFEPLHEITEDDLFRGLELRKAEDPDEDPLSYFIKVFDKPAIFPVPLDQEQIDFILEVTDGQLKDFQVIRVKQG